MSGCIVYEHENLVNGKRYFGITIRKPTDRWGNGGSGYKNNKHFWSAIQKYGWNQGFSHKILFEGLSEAEAREIEEMLIADYNTHDQKYGYNGTHGGELERPNEETRRKIGEANKNPSDETRRKMSEARKGKTFSEEHRRKISEALKGENHPNYGKPHSEETRRKMSEARRGEKNPLYGKHLSEEHRRKISDAHKGKTLSDGTRRKISETESRPVEAIDPETGLRVYYFKSGMDAELAGFAHSAISACCNGKRKTHKGYIWRFVEAESN